MSDLDGDGIWSGTYSFDNINEQLEYKYCYDNWAWKIEVPTLFIGQKSPRNALGRTPQRLSFTPLQA